MMPASYHATTLHGEAVRLDDYFFYGCPRSSGRAVESPDDLVYEMGPIVEVVLSQSGRWFIGRLFLSRRYVDDGTTHLIVFQRETFREARDADVVAWFEERLWRIPDSAAAILFKPIKASRVFEAPVTTEPQATGSPAVAHPDDTRAKIMYNARLAGSSWKRARALVEEAGLDKPKSDQAAIGIVDRWCDREGIDLLRTKHKQPNIKPK